MISSFFKKIFTLLLFPMLILNPGILAENSDPILHCHPAMFNTSGELSHGTRKIRQVVFQEPYIYCLIERNLEIHFNPKLYARHLFIHDHFISQWAVKVELSHGSRSRRCDDPYDKIRTGVPTFTLASETYTVWNCGDVELIDRLSMAIVAIQNLIPFQSGRRPRTTYFRSEKFLRFEKLLSSKSSIPLMLVEVNKCLNNPPAVQGTTWHYKHHRNFLWISYQCNETFSLGNEPGEVWNKMLECNHGNWTGEVPKCQVINSTAHTTEIIGWSIIPLVALALVAVGFACGRYRCCKRRGDSKNDGPKANQKVDSSGPPIADSALPPRAREEHIYESLDYSTVRQALNENNTSHNDNRREDIHLYDYPVLPGI